MNHIQLDRELHQVKDEVLLLYCEVLDCIANDPRNIERINHVLWVRHNLERMADRVTNICERVIFVATGRLGAISTHYTGYIY